MYSNLETICPILPHGQTVHQVSDETCRRSIPETKWGRTDRLWRTYHNTMPLSVAGYKKSILLHVHVSKMVQNEWQTV